MTYPDIVQSALGDEGVAARVDLGDDALFVTPTRTILYRADKLLSDESIEEFPHGAERVSASAGRRKGSITLDYGLDGERSFTVPAKRLDKVLHPVLAGTLNAAGVTDPGETVKETFRFSDLTLVITSARVVKHIGSAVWDEEFEEFHYDDVTNLSFEEGSVATTMVLTLGDRQERLKAPNEEARAVRERLTSTVLAHHGVDSLAALREKFSVDEDERSTARMSFGEGPTPLSVNPGELTNEPKNATRVASQEAATHDDQPVSTGTVEPVASETAPNPSSVDASMDAAVRDSRSSESRSDAAPDTDDDSDAVDAEATATSASDSADRFGSEPLLGPVDDEDSRAEADEEQSTTASNSEEDVRPDEDGLDALAAEVEALRESVDEQNERIARQEELIERLIVELRGRR